MWPAGYGARVPTGPDAPRVLLAYADRVGASMGGVGIRAVELARVLRDTLGARVTIAAAAWDGADVGVPVTVFEPHAPRALDALLANADAVVAQPGWPLVMRRLARADARLVFDLYDPEAFGTLEHFAAGSERRRRLMGAFAVDRVTTALRIGHHVICANERQRDLWIGAALASGLVTAERYDADPTLRSFLDVVPYGVPGQPPVARGAAWRERLGVAERDEAILWNGGVWSWLDLPTAIRATALLREHRPDAWLVGVGASIAAPAVRATEEARELARELGVLGEGVVFNDAWVPYDERADWLLAADCAISTHLDHLETRYSSRTRLLDCFWAGLPVVCTGGDELADRVSREDLGVVVAPGDAAAAAAGLERVLERGRAAYAAPLAAAAADLAWSRVAEPLVRWIANPAPPSPPDGRRGDRRVAERLRTAAYVGAAGALAAARVRPPRAG
jgi:glycosyltransferase involved in cell wall biosynthesis